MFRYRRRPGGPEYRPHAGARRRAPRPRRGRAERSVDRMRKSRVLGLIAATSLVAALGLGAGPNASATESNGAVKIFRLAYFPNVLDVTAGDSVRFNNID